jgi:hypothetical protein
MPNWVKAVLVVTAFMIPAAAYAQATASIVGTVRDASGGVIPGVTVEASSPALIEKTRSVVTSVTGQYSIEDLRPGIYTVTFTLAGFNTFKREGIELTGSFIATVNAEMKVGGVSETITVSGEAPVVDVTSSRTQETMAGDVVAAIPSSRQYGALTALVPAINVQGNDVGGAAGNVFSVFQIHGGRRNEGIVQVDGMSAGYQGMGVSSYVTEIGNAQEVNFALSGGLGEAVTGGPVMNIIGKQGGNMFAGSFFMNGTGSALQGTNIDANLVAQNFKQAQSVDKAFDINPSFGGPIKRDTLWFFATYRYQLNDQNVASMWVNLNAGNPNSYTYLPADGQNGRPLETVIDDGLWNNGSLRLTWQPTPKNKFNFWSDIQYICLHCVQGGSSSGLTFTAVVADPEGLQRNENHPNQMTQITWSSPLTNKLLVDVNLQLGPYFWWGSRQKNDFDATLIPVVDQAGFIPNLNYRSVGWTGHSGFTNVIQGALSYVTGSHTMKFGVRYFDNDANYPINYYNNSQLSYQFANGIPNQITEYADQASVQNQNQGFTALYAQDRWTFGRATLSGGLRFEYLHDWFGQQSFGPNVFLPNQIVFPAQSGPRHQKDIQPRFGASYDVFGNGKTAVKGFVGRYVTTDNTVNEWLFYSPAGNNYFVTNTTRTWNDTTPVGSPNYYIPNCNLQNPAANGDCGALANPAFGSTVSPYTVDPSTINGWNTREYSWDSSIGIQQQIAPRVSFDLTYNHRSWGNILATINRDLTPASFDSFVYNVPANPSLPGGGGYPLTFLDLKPQYFGQVNNYLTFANNVGGITNGYNGVDFSVNARWQALTFQGGFSTGNVTEDSCGVSAAHPEVNIFQAWGGTLSFFDPFWGSLGQWPQAFCHRESGWVTNVKGLATYNIPKWDVLVSGTFHSLPYPGNNFPSVTSQSLNGQAGVLFFQTNLGRPFANGAPLEFLNIVQPGALYGARLNGVDLRIGKNFRFSRTRTLVALDIFNLTNSNAPDVYQQTYGPTLINPAATYLNPLSVTQARLFKISAQIDF